MFQYLCYLTPFIIGMKITKINDKRISLNLKPKHETKGPRK
jgi:hypothetical protein